MYHLHESEKEYRMGDSGPKYLMKGPRASFGVVVIKAGEDFSNHLHSIMEENFFILEGELDFYVGGEKVTARVGEFVHIEPTEPHYLKNNGATDAKAIFCLAPYQETDKTALDNPPLA